MFAQTGDRDFQELVGANEVIVDAPPFEVQDEMMKMLSEGPGFSHQGSNASADGQVDALDEGRLDKWSKAELL